MRKIIVTIFFFIFSFSAYAAEPLVDAKWLDNNLKNSEVFVLDIRNKIDKGSYETFTQGHIPDSIYSDYLQDGWRTNVDGIKGQLPPIKEIEGLIGGLGINNKKHVIIVYGGVNSTDFGSAARVYWTFKTLGHDEVSILNGGYKAWESQDFKIETGDHNPKLVKFIAKFTDKYYANADDVIGVIKSKKIGIVDARPVAFFVGEKGIEGKEGRIKNSYNLQQQTLVNEDLATFKSVDEIKKLIGEWLVTENTSHWLGILQPKDIWCSEVLEWDKMIENEGFKVLDMLQKIKRSDGISIETLRCPIRINNQIYKSEMAAPLVGEHTEEINKEYKL